MLKVPRMLDEIDPLPAVGPALQFPVPPESWKAVPGKPHLYTLDGKLKYEPPVAPDEFVTSFPASEEPVDSTRQAMENLSTFGLPAMWRHGLVPSALGDALVAFKRTALEDVAIFPFAPTTRCEYEALYPKDPDTDEPVVIRLAPYA